ncbi:MAG TPA: hypothetical protein PLV65_06670 [Tenuifilaceae bacterium]|nr:hypothetical protein [Tenuifilaceae bacterium]
MQQRLLFALTLAFVILGNIFSFAASAFEGDANRTNRWIAASAYSEMLANKSAAQSPTSDKLLLMSGKDIVCEVKRVSEKFVFYTKPGSKDMEWIDRRLVKTIHYQNGVVEDLTKKEVEEKAPKDWNEVVLTKNADDIADMVKVGEIEVKHEATTRQHYFKPYTLESSAEILVRRQAAKKDADIALVIKVEHHRPYGDPPVVTIVAEAYKKQ